MIALRGAGELTTPQAKIFIDHVAEYFVDPVPLRSSMFLKHVCPKGNARLDEEHVQLVHPRMAQSIHCHFIVRDPIACRSRSKRFTDGISWSLPATVRGRKCNILKPPSTITAVLPQVSPRVCLPAAPAGPELIPPWLLVSNREETGASGGPTSSKSQRHCRVRASPCAAPERSCLLDLRPILVRDSLLDHILQLIDLPV